MKNHTTHKGKSQMTHEERLKTTSKKEMVTSQQYSQTTLTITSYILLLVDVINEQHQSKFNLLTKQTT